MIGEGDPVPSSPLVPKELSQPKRNGKRCSSILTAILTFGLTSSLIVVTVFTWFGLYRNGFAWDPKTTLFNYHPTMMSIGIIVLPSMGILSYRIFPFSKWVQKIIHAIIMFISLFFVALALIAIEISNFTMSSTHFWSIHTWCGIITVVFYYTQFIWGLLYMFPFAKLRKIQEFSIGWHRFSGLSIIWMATATILAGVSEFLNFGVSDNWRNYGKVYPNYAPEGILGNMFAIFVITNSLLMSLVLVGPMNKHLPKTEETT